MFYSFSIKCQVSCNNGDKTLHYNRNNKRWLTQNIKANKLNKYVSAECDSYMILFMQIEDENFFLQCLQCLQITES